MKKWLKFFFLSFFSNKTSKEGVKRGYTNVFLGFLLALVFLWSALALGDMLPFATHYNNSPDFQATVHNLLANADPDKRIYLEIEKGDLKLKKQGEEYGESLLVNTLENELDKQIYSANGYNAVVDSRPASTLAEVEAYYLSNDGKNTKISYADYLTLSDVPRLNFDFKLRYTGNALALDDKTVEGYKTYLESSTDENKSALEKLTKDLTDGNITKDEYGRSVYELYFAAYYPDISEYERTSAVPLLRNYYYHEYISKGIGNYIFIFDDYMTGSFETKGGNEVSFYGFYVNFDDGVLIDGGMSTTEASGLADEFIKDSFRSNWLLTAYAHVMNIISLVPFIALMLVVATLLPYSILRLSGVESITTLGGMLKIVGSYVWFSGFVSAVISVIISFFVNRSMLTVLPLVFFFVALVIRSTVFAVTESRLYRKQSEQRDAEGTEV